MLKNLKRWKRVTKIKPKIKQEVEKAAKFTNRS